MPIYEFECKDCGTKFEFLCRTSTEKVCCFCCKGKNLKRLFSSFAFKGDRAKGTSFSNCSGCSSKNCSTCK